MTGSCGCVGTPFSLQSDLQALRGHCCLAGENAAAALWGAAGPPARSHPVLALGPHGGWVPSGTACTAPKSSWRVNGSTIREACSTSTSAASPQLLPEASKRRKAPLHPYQGLSAGEHRPDLGEHHCSAHVPWVGHPANLLSNTHKQY